jgi:hypothetical protein
MKGGGQPSAALAVGSRAVVNQKTLGAMLVAPETGACGMRSLYCIDS